MKHLICLFGLCFSALTLSAMPTLNPADPAVLTNSAFLSCDPCWSTRVGYRGDFVTNRNLEDSFGEIQRFSIVANEALLIFNIWNVIDLYGFAGACSYDYYNDQLNSEIVPALTSVFGRSNDHFLWGVGVKAVIAHVCWKHMGETFIGFDAQVEYMMGNRFNEVTIDGVDVATNGMGFNYREAQVAFAIAHKIEFFVPYAALTWSSAKAYPTSPQFVGEGLEAVPLDQLNSRERFGLAFGTSLISARKMSVTAEARFFSETAFTICGQIRF